MSMFTATEFSGQWFDGVTALSRDALLTIDGSALHVRAPDRISDYPVDRVVPAARVAGVPLRLSLPDGSVVVVGSHADALAALLPSRGRSFAHRLEQNLVVVIAALVAVAAAAVFAWRDGVPWLAAKVATRIPLEAEADLGAATLAALDRFLFERTRLPVERRTEVQDAFDHLVEVAGVTQKPDLQFRRGRSLMGANALALPGGTIVVTDQLVTTVGSVDETAAVLAHEIGHQARRHAMKQMLESSATALIFGALLGDVSGVGSLAAVAPGVFVRLRYSRESEDEADRFAYDLLRRAGSSPARLADALEALDDSMCRRGAVGRADPDDDDVAKTCAKIREQGGQQPDYMGTHPDTLGRIARARAAAE